MDSLYKVCRYIRKSGVNIPIEMVRDQIWIDISKVECDLYKFEALYEEKEDIHKCKEAVDLYRPLLLEDYYEWTSYQEAFYDIRYT